MNLQSPLITEKRAKLVLKGLSALSATLLLTTILMQVALDLSDDQGSSGMQ
jgi:hypothetical protein